MDTYTHFGSGAPQSAQHLFAGWFRRWSNLSAVLKGPVSEHGSKLSIFENIQIDSVLQTSGVYTTTLTIFHVSEGGHLSQYDSFSLFLYHI